MRVQGRDLQGTPPACELAGNELLLPSDYSVELPLSETESVAFPGRRRFIGDAKNAPYRNTVERDINYPHPLLLFAGPRLSLLPFDPTRNSS
jgi:hypothetical protein